MTYRRFKNLYAAARQEAAPNISLPAAEEKSRTRITPRMALAAVAALAVLAGGTALWRLSRTDPVPAVPVDPTGPAPSARTEPTAVPTQPGADGVPVSETVTVIPALHAGTPLSELVAAEAPATVTESFVFPYTDTLNEDHTDCTGLYYNAADGTLFCCTHAARELLAARGLPGKAVRTKCFLPTYGLLLFTLDDVKGHPSYCADLKTGDLKRLDVDLYRSGTSMGGVVQELEDVPYALVFVTGDRKDGLYLIDLQTVSAVCLSDVYPPMDDARFTRGGRYVCYTLNGDHANDPGRTTLLYRIGDGAWQSFTGELLDELPDDSLLLIRTPEGVTAYDPAAKETRPLDALPEGYRRGLTVTDRYTSCGCECHLQMTDYKTDETYTLTTPYISAWARSADRRTLYYYVRGEDQIHLLDLVTGKEQVTAADGRMAEETETGEASARAVWFTLTVLPGEQLLLEYGVTDAPREDPEAAKEAVEGDVAWQLSRWENSDAPTIASMGDLLERFFADGLTAYEGNGFLFLDYSSLRSFHSLQRFVVFEDYRTGCVYLILHDQNSLFSPFIIRREDPSPLPDGAETASRRTLAERGIPILPAERDYGAFLKEGQLDVLMMLNDSLQTDMLHPSYFFLYRLDREDAESRFSIYDAGLTEFWRFTDTLDYRYLGYYSDEARRYEKGDFVLEVNGACRLYIGRYKGAPYIMRQYCVASISEADYEKWTAWMREQWPKQFTAPSAGT